MMVLRDGWYTKSELEALIAAALAQPEAVAAVTECEACFTPDVCQLRGKCDHYSAERLRVAAPRPPAVPEIGEELTRLRDIERRYINYLNGFGESHD